MNWRLLGVILLLTATPVLALAVEFTIKAVRFRLNSTEATGVIISSSPTQVLIAVKTKRGTEYISGHWGRYAWVGRQTPVLIPDETVSPGEKPIAKDRWWLFDGRLVVGLALLMVGAWLYMKGRTFDI